MTPNRDEALAIAHGARSSRAADLLRPFRPLIEGDVLVLGPEAAGVARVIRGWDGSPRVAVDADGVEPSARFDAVVALDPAGSTPDETVGRARDRLRPGGRLVLGLDNAAALRALAGGAPGEAAATRAGLRALLAGLDHQDWWFPFPGLRRPLSLIAERGLDGEAGFDAGALAAAAALFEPGRDAPGRPCLRRGWEQAHRAGLLGALAPAFLVAASAAPLPPDRRLALHLGPRRRPGFDRLVSFAAEADGVRVTRTPLDPASPAVIEGVENLLPAEPYRPGRSWQVALEDVVARDGWGLDEIAAWARTWTDALAGTFAGGRALAAGTPLPGRALDAIPKNLILAAEGPCFIDLEWRLAAPLDAGHLVMRGLVNALVDAAGGGLPADPGLTLLDLLRVVPAALGIPLSEAEIGERLAREERFQSVVSGTPVVRDLAWAAATGLASHGRAVAAREAAAVTALHRENAALHAKLALERAAHEAALAEAARRTDRVVAYAAELDRARERTEAALARAEEAARAREVEEVGRAREAERRRPLARLAQAWLPGRG